MKTAFAILRLLFLWVFLIPYSRKITRCSAIHIPRSPAAIFLKVYHGTILTTWYRTAAGQLFYATLDRTFKNKFAFASHIRAQVRKWFAKTLPSTDTSRKTSYRLIDLISNINNVLTSTPNAIRQRYPAPTLAPCEFVAQLPREWDLPLDDRDQSTTVQRADCVAIAPRVHLWWSCCWKQKS